MNFDFIPFKLNTDLSHFKRLIQYINSDNGVELYKAGDTLKIPILGIPVNAVNFYFFEGNLITVYIHLEENPENVEQVSKILQKKIRGQGKSLNIAEGVVIGWTEQTEFLGLVCIEKSEQLYLYFTLRKYSVFETEFSQTN